MLFPSRKGSQNILFYFFSTLYPYLIIFSLFFRPGPVYAGPALTVRHDVNVDSKNNVGQSVPPRKFDVKISLLKNKDYYWSLLSSINKAGKEISASMYLFKTSSSHAGRADKLLDALARAAGRGVKVDFILDESGNRRSGIGAINRKTSKRMIKEGINVRFDDLRKTTHTKVIVIDRKTVFLGSHNLTNSALQYNNEISVKIESAEVAETVLAYLEGIE